jgi:uncharacterized protein (DUF927 family)
MHPTRKQTAAKAKADEYFRAQEERLGGKKKSRKTRAKKTEKPKPEVYAPEPDARIVLEKLVIEGDADPFVARAFKDPGLPFEDDSLVALKALFAKKPAEYHRLRARLKTETDVSVVALEAKMRGAVGGVGADPEFSMASDGLYRRQEWLAQPFEVVGQARDAASNDWSKVVRFRIVGGQVRQVLVSVAALHADPAQAITALTFQGMEIKCTPSARQSFVEYLASAKTGELVTIANSTGWIEIGDERAFVLPDEIIGSAENVVLASRLTGPYERRGTLEEWRKYVAGPAGAHCLPRFSIAVALAGPLLGLGGFESGCFHPFGQSSEGKTTCVRCAASVWGSGADGGYMRTWRATSNGLEGNLAAACDTLLPLDEIGQTDGKEIGLALYMATAGVGKQRMRRDATLRASHKWRVLILSSGETPIETKLNEDLRRGRAHAGHLVRAIDIDARREFGAFDRPYPDAELDPKALAAALKRAVSLHYGTAGPEFVCRLIERRVTGEDLRNRVAAFVEDVLKDVKDVHGQAARAAERFGLVGVAGELAVKFGIVPWDEGLSTQDAADLFAAWLKTRGGATRYEAKQAVAQVRAFIERFGDSRFDDITSVTGVSTSAADFLDRKPVPDRAGYRQGNGTNRRWFVLPEVWKSEVCKGLDHQLVAKTLAELGALEHEGGRHTQVVWVAPLEKSVRAYVVLPNIFEG